MQRSCTCGRCRASASRPTQACGSTWLARLLHRESTSGEADERVSVVPQPVRNCARHPKLIPVYLRVRREIEAAGPGRKLEPRGEFEPKFAVEHVGILASAYAYWDDAKTREAGQQAAKRGWMTPAEPIEIGS
jgi:hypothetical protein